MCVVVYKFAGKFLTQLRQRDARLRNVLKCLGYCIKQTEIPFCRGYAL